MLVYVRKNSHLSCATYHTRFGSNPKLPHLLSSTHVAGKEMHISRVISSKPLAKRGSQQLSCTSIYYHAHLPIESCMSISFIMLLYLLPCTFNCIHTHRKFRR